VKRKTLQALVAIFFSVLLILSGIAPAYADYGNWTNPLNFKTPTAYGSRTYTRTQWMRFFTNYYDTDQPRTGTYAAPIGAYYGDVFDDLSSNNPNTGWTAIEKSPSSPPASTTVMAGDVSNWLEGYLGLNPSLYDSNYWLASPAYMQSKQQPVQINGTQYFVDSSWPLSNDANGSNQKADVPLTVGTALPDGSKPYVSNLNPPSDPYCFKSGPDIFEAGANNGTNTQYVWDGLASTEGTGASPIGDINLTQQAAANVFSNTTGTMTSGYVTASFPYNIMVSGVTKTSDSGGLAYYDWNVVNQTPLWLHGITVRVYTRGESTNAWTLVDQYNNIDMPPAMTDGSALKYGSSQSGSYTTSSGSVCVTPSGCWSVAQPMVNTSVPKPNEPYDVIVTADLDLNVSNGHLGTPTVDTGMTAQYWSGAVPPGLPSSETKEAWSAAPTIIGITLPSGYNDNVASANDNAGSSGGGGGSSGGGGSTSSNNLVATSLSQVNSNTLSFTFTGNMPESGTAYVRFYIQSTGGSLTGYGNVQQVHINASSGATVTTTAVPFGPSDVVFASVDADSSNSTTWIAAPAQGFQGDNGESYPETNYNDNYTCAVIAGSPPSGFTPAPQNQVHPTTYPILDKVITYKTVTVPVPVMGWKKVPLTLVPFTGHVRARLIPPPSGYDENGPIQ
jgi:hypothetical protein